MPFKIIENPKPRLAKIKMICDDPIDSKLLKVPAIKQCFSTNSTTLVCGGCGSGKSSLIFSLTKSVFHRCFADIFLIMPENSFASLSESDQNYFIKHLPEENIIHDLNVDILEKLYEKLKENAKYDNHSLALIDDYGHILKDKKIEKILNKICLKNRHLRTSVMILTQNYYMMGKKIREIMNNVVMFNTCKSQNEKLFKEQFDIKEEQFRELMRLLPTTHDYLLLNLKYKKIYHNWNEIVFDE